MRYLLSPDEERRLLRDLKTAFGLLPLAPPDSEEYPGDLEVLSDNIPKSPSPTQPYQYVFWANEFGPIRRVSDRAEPKDAVGRTMLQINRDAGIDNRAVDLETTPIVSWSRTKWVDENRRWIVPSRLGSTRAVFKTLSPEYRKMFRSVERFLQGKGQVINSWDIPNSLKETGLEFKRPRNTRSYGVTVWPEAAAWLDHGVKIYHWDV